MSLLVKCCMLRTSLHGQRIKLDARYHPFVVVVVVAVTVETSDILPGITDLSHPCRKQWEKRISSTIVDVLENASLLSSSFTSEEAKSKI